LSCFALFLVAAPARAEITGDEVGYGAEVWIGPSFTNHVQADPSTSAWDGGVDLGLLISVRWRILRGGIFADYAGDLFNADSTHVGGLGGVGWEALSWLRLEALGELGVDHLTHVGSDLFSNTSGDNSAFFPFIGVRLGIALRLGWENAGTLGLWFGFREDLGRATVHPTEEGWFGSPPTTQTWNVGGESFWIGLRAGLEK
jgi:hypothetical protein